MSNRLTTARFWEEEFWEVGSSAPPSVSFDPRHPEFRELHRFFVRHLPRQAGLRFLEVGCHPGRYLWYFHAQFAYDVAGIEYVEACCRVTRQALADAGVPAQIHHADLFEFEPPDGRRYDVVGSFGLVEHFREIAPVVARHADLLAPGGRLVIIVPNHRGFNGALLRAILPEFYAVHNQMTYADLIAAVQRAGDLDIIGGGYLGRFNLAPTNCCPYARARLRPGMYAWVERLHRWAVTCARVLPDSRVVSPYIGIVAQKPSRSG